MLTEMLPFRFDLNATAIAGASLWSLALYLSFPAVGEWLMHQIQRWFNFAERSLYTSESEFERTRKGRESQNAFYASLFSIVPFLIIGGLCNYGIELGLGSSWAISVGILACVGCGVYELGRRDGQSGDSTTHTSKYTYTNCPAQYWYYKTQCGKKKDFSRMSKAFLPEIWEINHSTVL